MEVLVISRVNYISSYSQALKQILQSNVSFFYNYREGIESLKSKQYNLVILDYFIFNLSLLEVIKEYQNIDNRYNSSIILIIENKEQELLINKANLGFNYFYLQEITSSSFFQFIYKASINSFLKEEECMNVLIVEDSIDDFELYSRILKSILNNYTIAHSTSAEDAWQLIKKEQFHLILLDNHLTGMKGVDFLSNFILLDKDIPIIALTGQGDEETAVRFIQLGAEDYIVKDNISIDSLSKSIFLALSKFTLKQLEKEKQCELSLFTQTVVHDLKSPLGRINSYVKLIQNQYPKVDYNYLQSIVDDTQYIKDFLESLSFYAMYGRSNTSLEIIDLNKVIKQSISNLEVDIKDKQANIEKSELPKVKGNYISLVQLFQNLISNAIRYCISKPIVKISSVLKENNLFVIVSDNGVGIIEDMYADIFQPFIRIPNGVESAGMGLGLSLCALIAKQNKAKITVSSREGKGSSFMIAFKANSI